jgi:hypothetical protein
MSETGSLDIRYPIGGLFAVLGLLLTGYGTATAGDVNLWWGLVMLVFGGLMLWSARRGWGRAAARPAIEDPEGREMLDR